MHRDHPWSDAIRQCRLIDHRTRFAVCREEPAESRETARPSPVLRKQRLQLCALPGGNPMHAGLSHLLV
jgi:hypothetical protein